MSSMESLHSLYAIKGKELAYYYFPQHTLTLLSCPIALAPIHSHVTSDKETEREAAACGALQNPGISSVGGTFASKF